MILNGVIPASPPPPHKIIQAIHFLIVNEATVMELCHYVSTKQHGSPWNILCVLRRNVRWPLSGTDTRTCGDRKASLVSFSADALPETTSKSWALSSTLFNYRFQYNSSLSLLKKRSGRTSFVHLYTLDVRTRFKPSLLSSSHKQRKRISEIWEILDFSDI